MAAYRMVYGDNEQVVRETYEGVELIKEDGWIALYRDGDAILRVREEHVQSLEAIED
jgi:hypothetical protein